MSINFKFTADASGVSLALKGIKGDLQELSAADFAMGLDAVLGLFNKLRGAVGQLGQMFSSCMREAAALEDVGTRLGVMLNNAASGDALATSLQRMATNGVVPLQELEKAVKYYHKRMTKDEIEQALKERGWTYQMLAEKLRVSEGSLRVQLSAHIELLLV